MFAAGNKAVALRKESVDRNTTVLAVLLMYSVALRKESVDRNKAFPGFLIGCIKSLSARRAWIEIASRYLSMPSWNVALRKESVDRNAKASSLAIRSCVSLSARRAWIEISGAKYR